MPVNRVLLRWGIPFFLFPALATAAPKATPQRPLSAPTSASSPSSAKDAHAAILDTARVRKLYMDGEFEAAIDILEKGLAEKRAFSHEDSVFIFKHLGVMYAAKYETRETGKRYMYQLLMTEPTAKIMDMYASDMIYMIFKNIQDEFDTQRGRYAHAKDLLGGNPPTDSVPIPHPPEKDPKPESGGGGHALLWVGATGAIAAAGVVAYFLLAPGGTKTVQKNHSVDSL